MEEWRFRDSRSGGSGGSGRLAGFGGPAGSGRLAGFGGPADLRGFGRFRRSKNLNWTTLVLTFSFSALLAFALVGCADGTDGANSNATEVNTTATIVENDSSSESLPDATALTLSSDGTYYTYADAPSASDFPSVEDGYESYSELDSLGRCGVAFAKVGEETTPDGERGDISEIHPTGWKQAFYEDLIEASNGALYNRCHLIAWSLAGENANELNLITGTRQLNETMTVFEQECTSYIYRKGGHILYRVTPHFSGSELVARGVEIEAFSVEDEGASVRFHVYIPNEQKGVEIDYATGKSWRA